MASNDLNHTWSQIIYHYQESGLLNKNGYLDLGDIGDLPLIPSDNIKGFYYTLWKWESRFADGGDVTGIVNGLLY